MRAATGGLAASDRITPASMSAISAASIGLSTVHHQAANGVRWARETMERASGQADGWVAGREYGWRGVKGLLRICAGCGLALKRRSKAFNRSLRAVVA